FEKCSIRKVALVASNLVDDSDHVRFVFAAAQQRLHDFVSGFLRQRVRKRLLRQARELLTHKQFVLAIFRQASSMSVRNALRFSDFCCCPLTGLTGGNTSSYI